MKPKEINITPRELEVIKLLRRGYSSRQVASQMKISFNTVETHRKKILKKFKAKNTPEMIGKALEFFGWIVKGKF